MDTAKLFALISLKLNFVHAISFFNSQCNCFCMLVIVLLTRAQMN